MATEESTPEEWRPIAGFEGRYEVSNLGRVRSPRLGKMMKPHLGTTGYFIIYLTGDTLTRTARIHHLVLEAFIGPRPDGYYGCHSNGVNTDNRLANLRWDTPASNQHDRVRHGTDCKGEKHPHAKLSEALVKKIRFMYDRKLALGEIARRFGICKSAVCMIGQRKAWPHVK